MSEKTITSANLEAFYENKSINVHGGFRIPKKGHHIEIGHEEGFVRDGKPVKSMSVPFSALMFPDENMADRVFHHCFGYPLSSGQEIDKKIGIKPIINIEKK